VVVVTERKTGLRTVPLGSVLIMIMVEPVRLLWNSLYAVLRYDWLLLLTFSEIHTFEDDSEDAVVAWFKMLEGLNTTMEHLTKDIRTKNRNRNVLNTKHWRTILGDSEGRGNRPGTCGTKLRRITGSTDWGTPPFSSVYLDECATVPWNAASCVLENPYIFRFHDNCYISFDANVRESKNQQSK
jgi:hypothetical protein